MAPVFTTEDWTEIVEVGFAIENGSMRIGSLMMGPTARTPNLAVAEVNDYRLWLHARGRDAAREHEYDNTGAIRPAEDYRIALWSKPTASPIILRASDRVGASARGSKENLRPLTAIDAAGLAAFTRL
ncbi:hypothetical protein [Frankia gtarii]|uniref:hypothetical protein n=1 Tax=Frankia gtarii TaxID=2950102 RepID=UPI0021BFB0D2|nr:hypothetical protein [Frankia gtarii]